MQEVFYWVFNMSITAAIVGSFVMAVRQIKKIPRRLAIFLWAVPFLRMAFPFGLDSPYSLMSLLSEVATKTTVVYHPQEIVQYSPTEYISFSAKNLILFADTYSPITYKTNVLEKVFEIASVVWIVVALAIFLMLTVIYFTTLHEIKGASHLRDNIYISDKCLTPAVYGIIRPKIVLPTSYIGKDNELVILHEREHIRRLDNLWRLLAFLLVAIHWFNPLCWIFLNAFLADIELSCDERVLVKLGNDRTKEYALSLLESSQSKTVFASAFGGAKIRTRIENILSFKKMTWVSLTAFAALIAMISYMLITNAG